MTTKRLVPALRKNALSELGQRTQDPPISWLMRMTLEHPELISLAAGFTDYESLPVREARELLQRLLGSPKTGRVALQYGSTPGDADLRRLTARRLQALDTGQTRPPSPDPIYDADRLLITNGSQQLLYMVTEVLCDPGDIVLVEDPTYFVFLGIMQSHGLRCRGIPLAEGGLDVEALDRILAGLKRAGELRRVKMLYVVSYYQNPTGLTTRFDKKQAALELLRQYERAAGHPIYLLEDAAYRELGSGEPEQAPASALAARGHGERIIYVGTYSKPFATGVRVGFGILPADLYRVVLRVKGNHDFGTSNLMQQLLAEAIRSGKYERHLAVLRRRYAFKARTMVRGIREYSPPNVHWVPPGGGLYLWAKLPRKVKTGIGSKLFKAALVREVLYVPGDLCYADDPTRPKPDHEMRLSFGGATVADMRTGLARLGEVLRRMC